MNKPVSEGKIDILKRLKGSRRLVVSDIKARAWINPRGGRVPYNIARCLVGSPLVRAVKLRDGGLTIEYEITPAGREAIPKEDEDEKKT